MIASIIVLILCILAGIAKSIQDVISFQYEYSFFNGCVLFWDEWNPVQSWKNKYKQDEHGRVIRKNGKPVEKFLGSSTVFVCITDPWHFFDKLKYVCIFTVALLAGLFSTSWFVVVSGVVLFYTAFHVFYTYIWK